MVSYLSVTESGIELMHDSKPTRKINWYQGKSWYNSNGRMMEVPKGTIKQLIGKDITFNDGPKSLRSNKVY